MKPHRNPRRESALAIVIVGLGVAALLVALLFGATDEKIGKLAASGALILGIIGASQLWRQPPLDPPSSFDNEERNSNSKREKP